MNFQRNVLIFSSFVLALFVLLVTAAGQRQGWFSPMVMFHVSFENAGGLYVGTPVTISGLKAGKVVAVDLDENNKILVSLGVQRRFAERIRQDAVAQLSRPFIIGEKEIAIIPGTPKTGLVQPGGTIRGEILFEITDMLSGGKMSGFMGTFNKLLEQLKLVVEGDGKSATLVELYKQAYTTLVAMETMTRDVTSIRSGFFEGKFVKELNASSDDVGLLMSQMQSLMPAVNQLAAQLAVMMPEMAKALREASFTMQAAQHSFILRGGAQEVREEQAKREQELAKQKASEPARVPAGRSLALPGKPMN